MCNSNKVHNRRVVQITLTRFIIFSKIKYITVRSDVTLFKYSCNTESCHPICSLTSSKLQKLEFRQLINDIVINFLSFLNFVSLKDIQK